MRIQQNPKEQSNLEEWKSSGDYVRVPSLISAFECGFGTPFGDGCSYEDIPGEFVRNVRMPYILRATGDSMHPNIMAGDKVIIEYTDKVRHKDIVAVYLNGKFMVKVYFQNGFSLYLKSTNKSFKPIKIMPDDEFHVLGVVAGIFREPDNFVIGEYLYD